MTEKQIQKLKVNKIYFEREEQIDSIINGFENRENIWLYGSTGTAKSGLFEDIAKGLGYSVHTLNDCAILYLYLECFNDLEKSRKIFSMKTNTPSVYYLHHPYLLEEYSNIIRSFFDVQQKHPNLFPFSFVVGESLWEVSNDKTKWLADYFQLQIKFEYIKKDENVIKLWKSYL